MKPTMLVIGDSFMSKDNHYPDQHWSEMLPEYNVVNLAVQGSSFSWIAEQLVTGLEHKPAVAVVGLTDEVRLTFDTDGRYLSSCQSWQLSSDQKLLYKLWITVMPSNIRYVSALAHISFIFETLRNNNIPFVWHRCLFDSTHPLFDDVAKFNSVFDKYSHCELLQSIWEHPHVDVPSFHIDNRDWQMRFANNVRSMLTNTQ